MAKPIPSNAVWLITGCSSGLGKHLSQVLSQSSSYRVVATARKEASLSYLADTPNVLKLALDVTSQSSIDSAVSATLSKFGRIDVLVNNAGYGLFGDTEAITDAQARAQLETNFWGAVNMTKAVLPIFRSTSEGGVVVQISSMGGYIAVAGNSFYHASKFALEGFTESVASEMFPEWNIRFLILEPGGMKTEYAKGSMVLPERHPAYKAKEGPTSILAGYLESPSIDETWADPTVVAKVMVGVLEKGNIPLRLPMGSDAWGMIKNDVDFTAKELEKWKELSESTSGAAQLASIDFLKK